MFKHVLAYSLSSELPVYASVAPCYISQLCCCMLVLFTSFPKEESELIPRSSHFSKLLYCFSSTRMDKEQNIKKDVAAEARLKRKSILRERHTYRSRSGSQNRNLQLPQNNVDGTANHVHTTVVCMDVARKEVAGGLRNSTPLFDITFNVLNEKNQSNVQLNNMFNSISYVYT
ncbi:hypothetical protein E2542_SST11057 [Spatholobus suberectus]|nr:hypothetical protein E2542_SST11057 [Spatholobus suberectus]